MDKKMMDEIIEQAKKLLFKVLVEAGVPESHGYGHAVAVLDNLDKTLHSN
jgi:hypothetical protein